MIICHTTSSKVILIITKNRAKRRVASFIFLSIRLCIPSLLYWYWQFSFWLILSSWKTLRCQYFSSSISTGECCCCCRLFGTKKVIFLNSIAISARTRISWFEKDICCREGYTLTSLLNHWLPHVNDAYRSDFKSSKASFISSSQMVLVSSLVLVNSKQVQWILSLSHIFRHHVFLGGAGVLVFHYFSHHRGKSFLILLLI